MLVESTVELTFGGVVRVASTTASGLATVSTSSWRRLRPRRQWTVATSRESRERFVTLLYTCDLYLAMVRHTVRVVAETRA